MQQVTELPADHRVAGEWQVEGVGPKGGSSTLFMTPHNNILQQLGKLEQHSIYQCKN